MKYNKIILLLFILFISGMITYWLVNYLKSPTVINVVKNTAYEINKRCPIMTDNESRLDSVDVLEYPVRSIRMHYTLSGLLISDSNTIEHTRNYFVPRLIEKVKSDSDLQFLRDHSVVITYIYRDEQGKLIFEYPIGPKEWQ